MKYHISTIENGNTIESAFLSSLDEVLSWFKESYRHHTRKDADEETISLFEDRYELTYTDGNLEIDWIVL